MLRTAALSLTLTASAFGQFSFNEEFNVSLSYSWGLGTPFPQFEIAGSPGVFDGIPGYDNFGLDGAQTYLFGRTLARRHYVGMVAQPTLMGPRGELTARINTMNQDAQHIDGLFTLLLVDATDSSKWIQTFLFGSNYSTDRRWGGQTSFAGAQSFTVGYANNTWYRPQLYVSGRVVRTSLFADDGTTLLGQYEFITPEGYFSGLWKVAMGQYMGLPDADTYQTLVAVDWIRGRTLACGPGDIGSTGGAHGADGVLDNNDFVVYIDDFFGGLPSADIGSVGGVHGADGQLNNNDFVAFIDLFFSGC